MISPLKNYSEWILKEFSRYNKKSNEELEVEVRFNVTREIFERVKIELTLKCGQPIVNKTTDYYTVDKKRLSLNINNQYVIITKEQKGYRKDEDYNFKIAFSVEKN